MEIVIQTTFVYENEHPSVVPDIYLLISSSSFCVCMWKETNFLLSAVGKFIVDIYRQASAKYFIPFETEIIIVDFNMGSHQTAFY